MPLRFALNGSLDFGTATEIPEPSAFSLMALAAGVASACRLLATRKRQHI
jgi:hypothetical protein